ncbi:MAG: hypothetical protein ABIQ18_30620, partial [Umezawaea sp.]
MGEAADLGDAADAGLFWVARDRADGAVLALLADGAVLALNVGPALGVADGLPLALTDGLALGDPEAVAAGNRVSESAAAKLSP